MKILFGELGLNFEINYKTENSKKVFFIKNDELELDVSGKNLLELYENLSNKITLVEDVIKSERYLRFYLKENLENLFPNKKFNQKLDDELYDRLSFLVNKYDINIRKMMENKKMFAFFNNVFDLVKDSDLVPSLPLLAYCVEKHNNELAENWTESPILLNSVRRLLGYTDPNFY